MSPHERLARLRPRDVDVCRALIAFPAWNEARIAAQLGMSIHTLKARLKRIYLVLDVISRLHLYALFHAHLGPCGCTPTPSEAPG